MTLTIRQLAERIVAQIDVNGPYKPRKLKTDDAHRLTREARHKAKESPAKRAERKRARHAWELKNKDALRRRADVVRKHREQLGLTSMAIRPANSTPFRSASMVATTSIRFLPDINEQLQAIQENVRVLDAKLRRQRQALQAGVLFNIDQTEMKTSPTIRVAKEFSQKSLKALREQSAIMSQLRATLDSLDALDARLKAQFPDNSTEVMDTRLAMRKTRETIIQKLNEAYAANQDMAKSGVPKPLELLADELAKALARCIQFETSQTYVHVFEAQPSTNLCISYYFYLQQCVADDGEHVAALSVVLTYDVIAKAFWLNVSHTFDPPTEANMVVKVSNVKSALVALRTLLNRMSYANSIGDIPLKLLVAPEKIRRELFSPAQYISSLDIDEATHTWTFRLKPSVKDANDAQRILNQLYLDIRGLQAKTAARLTQMKVKDKRGWKLLFRLNFASSRMRATPDDLQFLSENFQLDPDAINRVLHIINSN